jgi:RNA polymerase sigma factor (sigma-70 family)
LRHRRAQEIVGGRRQPQALLNRVHDVDVMTEQRFDDLFRDHYPRLVALGFAMSGSHEIARELAQETMLRAHHRWGEIIAFDRPGAWLRRVMTNLLIDYHRSRSAERAALERFGSRGMIGGEDDSSDWAAWTDLVAPLPIRQRAIVSLFYGDDRSIDEISKILEISPGTVKSALSKARRRLQDLFKEETSHG